MQAHEIPFIRDYRTDVVTNDLVQKNVWEVEDVVEEYHQCKKKREVGDSWLENVNARTASNGPNTSIPTRHT